VPQLVRERAAEGEHAMSRGPGRMQRFVLDQLREHTRCRAYRDDRESQWQSLKLLAWCYRRDQMAQHLGRELQWHELRELGDGYDLVVQESLRRAILQLAASCRVEVSRPGSGGLLCRLSVDEWHDLLSVEECSTLSTAEAGALIADVAELIGRLP
jgi:hypothetical protein